MASRASAGRVKRGQSVEFTDYRDYALGDDLRSLDWNVYARLEKLFIKLFVEEEDVTVHVLLDASASMDGGTPDKLVFGKRAAAAMAYIGLASYDRVNIAVLQGRTARALPAGARHGPRVPGARRPVRRDARTRAPPTSPRPPATTPRRSPSAGRCCSSPTCSTRPIERAISELAGTRCDVAVLQTLSTDELDPPIEGDIRLVDRETGDGVDITADLGVLDEYRARLAAWQEHLDDRLPQARRGLPAARHDAAAGGPRLRGAAAPAGGRVTRGREADRRP